MPYAAAATDIRPGDADEWREYLLGKKKLSSATVSREVKRARQYFRAAARKRLIGENPFADLPAPQQVNKSREHFVTLDVTEKVLGACPRRRVAADRRPESIRRSAVPLRALGLGMDGRRLGGRADHDPPPQD